MTFARLPVAGPWITPAEIAEVTRAAESAWYEGAGSFVARFEEAFATHTGRAYAMALPSCTSGLHLALAALGIGPGDEVIVPDCTWIATAAPISYVGATAVFADIDPVTWCLDPDAVEALINDRTRAIIAVDLYGCMADTPALSKLADDHGIALIEDAAEAIGSRIGDQEAGSFGDVSVFSFHGSKTLTTGEGGMLLTDDATLFQRMNVLRDHGRVPGDTAFMNQEVAFKYKMSDLQAALGLGQLARLEELVSAKRRIFSWYAERLSDIPGLILNAEPHGTRNSYWMTTVITSPRGPDKDELGATLRLSGIDTRPFFRPLSSLPAYANAKEAEVARKTNTVSYRLAPYGLNLPSALRLTEHDVDRAAQALRDALTPLR